MATVVPMRVATKAMDYFRLLSNVFFAAKTLNTGGGGGETGRREARWGGWGFRDELCNRVIVRSTFIKIKIIMKSAFLNFMLKQV